MGKPRLRGREVTSLGPCSKPSMTELDLESKFLESETRMPSETFAVLARASLPQPHPHPGYCRLIMCVFGFSQTLPCPMDCSPPGPSVHGIFLARTPEWVAGALPRMHLASPVLWADSVLLATWEAQLIIITHIYLHFSM